MMAWWRMCVPQLSLVGYKKTPIQAPSRAFCRYYTVAGYIVFFIIGTVAIPHIYPPAKWYYCATAYAIAPFMAVANGARCCH